MAFHKQSVAIAVIGVTGSGKSTFINLASGSNSSVRRSLGSCPTELDLSTFSLDGRTVTLIDTPGFDDATPNVLSVLKLISDSFAELHSQGVRLAGIIYMHPLAEDHMGSPSRRNFLMFCKFCGETSLRDVLVVASKRSENEPSEAREHEFANKDEVFRPAIDQGARMLHHDGSQASAHAILRRLINREPTAAPVQGGSSSDRKNPTHTAAGADTVRELTVQVEHHAKVFGELYRGIGAATLADDGQTKKALQEKAENSLEKISRIRYDLEQMVTGFATENSRLEDENRRYKEHFSVQEAETELRLRLLEVERRARELAEVERGRAEAQLAEERALWERRRTEREILRNHAGAKYLVCGALTLALFCMSRFVFDGSNTLL